MFFQFIVILIAIGAAVGDYSDCMTRLRNDCFSKDLPKEFPTSPESLRRDCVTLGRMLRCAKNIFDSCPGAETEAREAEIFLNTLEESCDENGDTYEVLSRHVSCAGPIFNNIDDVCGPYSSIGHETFRPVYIENDFQLVHCSRMVQRIMCTSVAISKSCGAELKDIVADLLRKVVLEYDIVCTPDVLSKLQPYIENYENVLLQRDFSTNVLNIL